MSATWRETNMNKPNVRKMHPDDNQSTSLWYDERAQDTVQYLTGWLAHHNHSTDMGRW
jgi:hypothetical protein